MKIAINFMIEIRVMNTLEDGVLPEGVLRQMNELSWDVLKR